MGPHPIPGRATRPGRLQARRDLATTPSLHVVADVRSAVSSPHELPGEGLPAEIVVRPAYEVALAGVEKSSHVLVLGWLHQADRDAWDGSSSKRHPDGGRRGAFATRCPDRPNPVSVSVARVTAIEGLHIRVDRLDLVDGTPVVDLKPYVPGEDGAFSATRERRFRYDAATEGSVAGFLVPILERHLGGHASDHEAQLALQATIRAVVGLRVDPRQPDLNVTVNRPGPALDALQGLTGATFASGRIRIDPRGGPLRITFSCAGKELRLRETLPAANRLADD